MSAINSSFRFEIFSFTVVDKFCIFTLCKSFKSDFEPDLRSHICHLTGSLFMWLSIVLLLVLSFEC